MRTQRLVSKRRIVKREHSGHFSGPKDHLLVTDMKHTPIQLNDLKYEMDHLLISKNDSLRLTWFDLSILWFNCEEIAVHHEHLNKFNTCT